MELYYRKPLIKSALIRVLLFFLSFLIVLVLFEGFGKLLMEDWFPNVNQNSPKYFAISRSLVTAAMFIVIYFFRTKIDRRPFLSKWFALTNRKMDLVVGFLVGASLIAVSAFILHKLGLVKFLPGEMSLSMGLQLVLLFFVAALLEELVLRGYIQENLQEQFHPAIAIVLTSGLFMLIHLANPNLDTIPIINLFLAGILLGASFIFTKNLWFPLGLHWSWNLFQGPVFGFEVSGMQFSSLFHQEIEEQSIWTGGSFGLEGSILATILICVASIIILYQFNRFSRHENS